MAKVTAKRVAVETGLSGVCQGPRGYYLKVNGEVVGEIIAQREDIWSRNYTGWKFVFYKSNLLTLEKRVSSKTLFPLTDEGLEHCRIAALTILKKYTK